MTRKLLLPKELGELLLRRYNNQHKSWLLGEGQWPLSVSLGVPTENDVASNAPGVRRWVDAWTTWSGPGKVSWVSRQWARLGTQQLPATLALASPLDAAGVVGQARRWTVVERRYRRLIERWPQLAGQTVVGRHFSVLADYPDQDFSRLMAMLDWLERNPASGLAPRQLPIVGLDTKWLEKRTGLITDLLRGILGNDAPGDFYSVCGLRRPAVRIRLRILCPRLRQRVGGLNDIEAPILELAQLAISPQRILIVENLETGLALPDMDGAVAFMRLGNAVSVLGELPWLKRADVIYWGDIDTHGYAILNRARSMFPDLSTVLMDQETLLSYRDLWGEEDPQSPETTLPLLTEPECTVFYGLKDGLWGRQLRLEQERIPWPIALDNLRTAIGSVQRDSVDRSSPMGGCGSQRRSPCSQQERIAVLPPQGFPSWLDYAVACMDARFMEIDSLFGAASGGAVPSPEEMRQSLQDELRELRALATVGRQRPAKSPGKE